VKPCAQTGCSAVSHARNLAAGPRQADAGRASTPLRASRPEVKMAGGRARGLDLLYAPFLGDTTPCSIHRFRRASRVARPSQAGKKRTAVWASRNEDLVSDGGVAPPVCDHLGVPARWVVLTRCNPPGSAVDAGRDATARVLGAARAADGGVVDVPQALHGSPSASPMHAQRDARLDYYDTRHGLPPKK